MMNLITYLPDLLNGLLITIILTLSSLGVGLTLAVCMTMCIYSGHFVLTKLVHIIIFFIRGTPLLVQIFLLYFGAGQFAWLRESFLWWILKAPMGCAIIALSINTACYTTILLLGGINSVPKNEIAACHALGMTKWQAFRRIIFPRAFRIALPAYSNEVIMILKGTSLASTITLLDLMGVLQQLISQTYDTVQWYIVGGILYLALNSVIILIFKKLQRFSAVTHN